jgi:hypothetical protein
MPRRPKDPPKLNYKLEIPQNYEYYKNKTKTTTAYGTCEGELKSLNESTNQLMGE